MIIEWILTGDTHGDVLLRLKNIRKNINSSPNNTGVIILGDAGYNFWLDDRDKLHKRDTLGYQVYCVRGNHEARPESLGYIKEYDDEVKNDIYIDPINKNIHYFIDGLVYDLKGYKTLILGGAYSIDKFYRLERNAPWFENEQLSADERTEIFNRIKGKDFDIILSHTCPYDWSPFDLFLSFINQDAVDKSMEFWLDMVKDNVNWKYWFFGHYHADRLVRPGVVMFFTGYETLENTINIFNPDNEFELSLLSKDPNYFI